MLDALTVDEKARLTAGEDAWHVPGIDRFAIGRLKLSDGPAGVRGARFVGTTSLSFPCGVALGAMWDPQLVQRVGEALAEEARTKRVHVVLGPTINIQRVPLAGRTFECFSEDPYLTSRLAVAYITGVQSRGVGCAVKHFACNDQEKARMTISAEVDERTLREIHLPGFEAAVREAGVWLVMSAYNRLNGTYCGEHPELLRRILKEEWGFDGVVVSDWHGTHSTAEAANAGLDLEMPGPPAWLGAKLAAAVDAGQVSADVLDAAVRRLLRLMERTGVLDDATGDEADLDARDPEQSVDDGGRRRLARQAAVQGTVLVHNDGLLPLDSRSLRRVAVIGPNAHRFEGQGGGSAEVNPHRLMSLVETLRRRLEPRVEVVHEPGCRIDRGATPIDLTRLTPVEGEGGHGFTVHYFSDETVQGEPVHRTVARSTRLYWMGDPEPGLATETSRGPLGIVVMADFVPDVSGTWQLSLTSAGRSRLFLDAELMVDNWEPQRSNSFYGSGSTTIVADAELMAGTSYRLRVELLAPRAPIAGVNIGADPPLDRGAMKRAITAAREADVAIVVVGTNSQWETEGRDRRDLRLPGEQDELIGRIIAANPDTVVIVNAGAPLEMPWVASARSILLPWFAGEEGAEAVADLLLGEANPSGRLPITWPRQLEDTPADPFYPGGDGKARYGEGLLVGYRHYDSKGVEPLFCFGHGLSYTSFDYGPPEVRRNSDDVDVELVVTNTGDRAGAEVVQAYVSALDSSVRRADKELRAFSRIELEPGEARGVRLRLDSRAFSYWDVERGAWRVSPGEYDVLVGASSRDIRGVARVSVDP
jgi:beta-glucosidase